MLGRDSIIGWNLNQPEKHDGIEYWFIQGYVSKGMFKEPHAVDEFQKLKPIIKSPPYVGLRLTLFYSFMCVKIK